MEKQQGRPRGKPYPVIKQLRLSEKDAADLAALVEKLRSTEAEVMRQALRRLAQAEGLE